jgi:hypothetical protein
MKRRGRLLALLLALVVAAAVITVVAGAGARDTQTTTSGTDSAAIPAGPEVDFCPSPELTQAHWKEHGFDDKPIVFCGPDDGQDKPQPGLVDEDDFSAAQREAAEQALLKSAKPAADDDGDPTTIEGVLPHGRPIVISISTSDPDRFKGMTPAEYAELAFDGGSPVPGN